MSARRGWRGGREMAMRGKWLVLAASLGLAALSADATIVFDNSFRSPRNKERPLRSSTSLIILHTTEAPSRSALRKLRDMGECHYCIDEHGRVYRIIDHRRVAFHAGRSMWNGRSNVDEFSVGIEVAGYHNRKMNPAQMRALAALIGELQHLYRIPDHQVLAHSHVAYGAPNRWHRRRHRGRKRCAMFFALPSVRAQLNLTARPTFDPDVRARRLVVADPYLERMLYGSVTAPPRAAAPRQAADGGDADNVIAQGRSAWDIARDAYNDATTLYRFPDGTQRRGNQIADFREIPAGTRVTVNAPARNVPETFRVIGRDGRVQDIVGQEALSATTIYIYPDGRYVRGSQLRADTVLKLPYGTRALLGYAVGGPITATRSVLEVVGNRWRSPDTFFLISGALVPGNQVDDEKIPVGSMVFFKQ